MFTYMHCDIFYLYNVYTSALEGSHRVSNSQCAVLENHTLRSNREQHNSGEQRQDGSSSDLSVGCCGR